MEAESGVVQYVPCLMIDGDGKTFVKSQLDKVLATIRRSISSPGATINVVSVVGAQNSGKSTLLNGTFGCRFDVMNATSGVNQTTKGLLASDCNIPNLLVVDVEGCDGTERAEEGNEAFERQAALFALTFSHVMIFNMNCTDAGRRYGGCIPLFETIFKECVTLQPGKTRVLVVLRRYDGQTSVEQLEKKLMDNLMRTWDNVNNPKGLENSFPFSEYIDVKVKALRDKVLQPKEYEHEVAELKKWFETEAFVGLQTHKGTASEFSFSAEKIWMQILENKQLDLPSHREMVSAHFCGEVKRECFASLDKDGDYLSLQSGKIKSPQEFSDTLESLLNRLIDRYEEETKTYNGKVKDKKSNELIDDILRITSTHCYKMAQSNLSSECMKLIIAELTDNPTASVQDMVETYSAPKLFDMCKVLSPRFPALSSRNMINTLKANLVNEANEAKIKLDNKRIIETERRAKELERQIAEKDKELTKELQRQIAEKDKELTKELQRQIAEKDKELTVARLQAQHQAPPPRQPNAAENLAQGLVDVFTFGLAPRLFR